MGLEPREQPVGEALWEAELEEGSWGKGDGRTGGWGGQAWLLGCWLPKLHTHTEQKFQLHKTALSSELQSLLGEAPGLTCPTGLMCHSVAFLGISHPGSGLPSSPSPLWGSLGGPLCSLPISATSGSQAHLEHPCGFHGYWAGLHRLTSAWLYQVRECYLLPWSPELAVSQPQGAQPAPQQLCPLSQQSLSS